MNTLIVTIGLPRSGKSTWAKSMGFPIVNPDSIRLALHGETFLAPAEPMVWTIARYMVHALFLAGHETVILDATNVIKARRDEWISTEWNVRYKVFDVNAVECEKRAVRSERPDLITVIWRMAAQFQRLDVQEEERRL